jgi:hypothetical protein
MFGGLTKSASRLALVAAASTLMTGSAFAADLGGDCCADLEERVAELEATTVRKGNRKVSLTLSGQVNRTTMYYNDGSRSGTYFSLDNTNSSSRFALTGSAKISPTLSAGYNMLIEVSDKARSVNATQASEDGVTRTVQSASGDQLLQIRDAVVWMESSSLGRVTMGRLTNSTHPGVIDLGGTGVVAPGTVLIGNGIRLRDSAGNLTSQTIGSVTDNAADYGIRMEGVKYTTPTFAGFVASAAIGESASISNAALPEKHYNGQVYGADLKYAGEFSGVRIAAGVGYERSELDTSNGTSVQTGGVATFAQRIQQYGLGLSALHVPTGLFLQGDYFVSKRAAVNSVAADGTAVYNADVEASRYIIQGGISQNWFGVGKTALFGEYGKHKGWAQANQQDNSFTGLTGGATTAVNSGGDNKFFGIGAVQNFDAAALELFIGWRRFQTDDANVTTRSFNTDGTVKSVGAANVTYKDVDIVAAGARIKF